VLIIWVLKQQEYPPDIVRKIYQLVVRSLNPAQLFTAGIKDSNRPLQ